MEVNEDDEEMFDYNNINSEIKADADNNFKEEEHQETKTESLPKARKAKKKAKKVEKKKIT